MRTREAKMSDYDVPKEDEAQLDIYCRSPDPEIKLILFGCAISKAPGMEIVIYESLTAKDPKEAGYYSLIRRGRDIPAKTDDFYGYRRKVKAEFYHRLKLFGRWEYKY